MSLTCNMNVILFQSYSVQNVKNTKMLKAGKKLAFTENFLVKAFQIIDALLRFLFPHCVQNRYILMKGADFENTSLLVALALPLFTGQCRSLTFLSCAFLILQVEILYSLYFRWVFCLYYAMPIFFSCTFSLRRKSLCCGSTIWHHHPVIYQ